MDLEIARRVIESSPIIVLVMGYAIYILWRALNAKDTRADAKDELINKRMEVKDQMLLNLQRETLVALSSVTTAVSDLKEAISRRA